MKLIPRMIDDVLKNLFRFPATVPYPKRKVTPPERFRGMIEISEACVACGMCVAACPAKCIKLERTQIAYWMPHCIFCGRCADVCPVDAVIFTHNYEEARGDKDFYSKRVYQMAKCSSCGKDTMPAAQKKYLIEVKKANPALLEKCAECRLKGTTRTEAKPESGGSGDSKEVGNRASGGEDKVSDSGSSKKTGSGTSNGEAEGKVSDSGDSKEAGGETSGAGEKAAESEAGETGSSESSGAEVGGSEGSEKTSNEGSVDKGADSGGGDAKPDDPAFEGPPWVKRK